MAGKRRTRMAAGAVMAALAGAVALAPMATAGESTAQDVYTPFWHWQSVGDNGLRISEASPYYPSPWGASQAMYGWGIDSFDGMFFDLNGLQGDWIYDGSEIPMNIVPADVPEYVDGGTTYTVGAQTLDFGDGVSFEVNVLLTIQGSFARWTWDIVDTGAGEESGLSYSLSGGLGSFPGTVVVPVGAQGLVTYQSATVGQGTDALIGWYLEREGTAAYNVSNGDDRMTITGTGDFTLYAGLVDWDPCSFDDAYTYLVGIVPNFQTIFGDTLGSFYTNDCLALPAPPAQVAGTPLDVLVPIELPAEYENWFASSGLDYFAGIGIEFLNLPAGVSGNLVENGGNWFIHLTGTTPNSAEEISVVIYSEFLDSTPTFPFRSTFVLSATTAQTGTSESTPWIAGAAGALIAMGAALVVWRRRTR